MRTNWIEKAAFANWDACFKSWVYKGVCNRGHKSGSCFINIEHKNQNRLNNGNTVSIWIWPPIP